MALVMLLHGDERMLTEAVALVILQACICGNYRHTHTLIDVYLSSLHDTERQEWVVIVSVG